MRRTTQMCERMTGGWMVCGTLILAAGCAMEVDDVGDVGMVAAPLSGPPPAPPPSQTNGGPNGHNRWSVGQGSNGWSAVRMGDVDGNGFADLCGRYGNSYGCARRLGNTWFEGFMEAPAFASNSPSVLSTIQVVDVTDDGRADLCGRTRDGIVCHISNGSSFGPAQIWQSALSDRNGWNRPEYYKTIGFARLHNIVGPGSAPAVCGRGIAGVHCYYRNSAGDGFVNTPTLQTSFRDSNGWNQAQYYETLAYPDINGDGFSDICGRGSAGIWCSLYRDGAYRSFGSARLWTSQYRNSTGWSNPIYYSSVTFGDINGDGRDDVCGRGTSGVYCGVSVSYYGIFNHTSTLDVPGMSNANGWSNAPMFYSSLSLVDYDGDRRADVCGVGPRNGAFPELYCARSTSGLSPRFDGLLRRTTNSGIVERFATGRIHRSGTTGFCWDNPVSDVECTNSW